MNQPFSAARVSASSVLLALGPACLCAQITTDDDIPAILNDGSNSTTAEYVIGDATDYQFTLSQAGNSLFIVGNDNPRNTLTIKNGADADFEDGSVTVGASADTDHNNVYVTGAGSTVSNTGALRIGTGGSSSNLLSVLSSATFASNGDVYIGQTADSDLNRLAVSGGATLSTASSRDVYVGYNGSNNSLMVTSGGQANLADRLEIGYYGTNTTVQVTGTGSLLAVSNRIQFGTGGGENNTLTVSNGATLTNGNDVTFYSSNNAMTVAGSGSMATLTGLDLGYGSSTGNTLTVSDGGLVALTQTDVTIVSGNVLRLDDGYIAWLGDRTSQFDSFITGSAIQISDGAGGWITATSDNLTMQYFGGDDTAAYNFSGYAHLGNYTIIGTLSAVPEPSTYASLTAAVALGATLLRRRRAPGAPNSDSSEPIDSAS